MEIQLWREILAPYQLAVDELVVKFNHVKQQYQNAKMYSPIEMVSGRVKRVTSILEKAQRKGVSMENLTEKIEDIAGIRLICQFVEDIEKRLHNKCKRKWLQKLPYHCLLYGSDG